MADGHLGKCKECAKSDVQHNYVARRDQYMAYEKLPERVMSRHRRALGNLHAHRARHPEKNRARAKVAGALRAGRLKKLPCEVCGALKVEAHHADYAKPLEVQWLCHQHHRQAEGRYVVTPS